MKPKPYFSFETYRFLRELALNNRREWFTANKERYEETVRLPAQRFIVDFGPVLRKISSHFTADPRPVGGSLFRIYRDVRFGRDKRPYKTHLGIQFRHESAKDAHTPGFYLHIEPAGSFLAAGIWHPDAPTLARIRQAIDADPKSWKKARDDQRFRSLFELSGDSLLRIPRGYDAEHPFAEDLMRKDFIASLSLTEREVTASSFLAYFAAACAAVSPFVRYLCRATGLPF